MAILLRRNSKHDPFFHASNTLVIDGDIVELLQIDNTFQHSKMPASIRVNIIRKSHKPFWANLDCYDYVRK